MTGHYTACYTLSCRNELIKAITATETPSAVIFLPGNAPFWAKEMKGGPAWK
nr:MAG TPA: hypothetical protein [Caudoviricetes sp.]